MSANSGILDFNKPTKINQGGGFEGGPTGGYVPQMSDADNRKWKAKHINKGKAGERIEIRKAFGPTQILIFVAKDGWNYSEKHEVADHDHNWSRRPNGRPEVGTKGKNVRVSMNGPLKLTWDEYNELTQAIEEAKTLLV